MKNLKKKIAALALVAAMGGTAAYGTLAFFTAQDTVTNEFTVGKGITIDLTETHWDDGSTKNNQKETWNKVVFEKDPTVTAVDGATGAFGKAQATNLLPGRIIPKNPMITMEAASSDAYVRMTITMPTALYAKSNLGGGNMVLFKNDTSMGINSSWTKLGETTSGTDTIITYRYKEKVVTSTENKDLDRLFNYIVIDGANATNGTKGTLTETKFSVVVKAYAVQTEGFTDEAAAFAAVTF